MSRNSIIVFVRKLATSLVIFSALWAILYSFQNYNLASYLPRDWILLLHVFGAVVFLGNIIVTAAWMFGAGRSEQPLVINFASNRINRCDMYFIQPGVFVLLVTGLILAIDFGGVFDAGWMVVGVVLFSLSGVVWGLFLRKYQNRMVKITENCLVANDNASASTVSVALPDEFYSVLYRWYSWGVVAMILVVASLGFMSLKPHLW